MASAEVLSQLKAWKETLFMLFRFLSIVHAFTGQKEKENCFPQP